MPELPATDESLGRILRTVRMIVEQDLPNSDRDTRELLIGHLTGAIFVLTTDRATGDG